MKQSTMLMYGAGAVGVGGLAYLALRKPAAAAPAPTTPATPTPPPAPVSSQNYTTSAPLIGPPSSLFRVSASAPGVAIGAAYKAANAPIFTSRSIPGVSGQGVTQQYVQPSSDVCDPPLADLVVAAWHVWDCDPTNPSTVPARCAPDGIYYAVPQYVPANEGGQTSLGYVPPQAAYWTNYGAGGGPGAPGPYDFVSDLVDRSVAPDRQLGIGVTGLRAYDDGSGDGFDVATWLATPPGVVPPGWEYACEQVGKAWLEAGGSPPAWLAPVGAALSAAGSVIGAEVIATLASMIGLDLGAMGAGSAIVALGASILAAL